MSRIQGLTVGRSVTVRVILLVDAAEGKQQMSWRRPGSSLLFLRFLSDGLATRICIMDRFNYLYLSYIISRDPVQFPNGKQRDV